MTSSIKTIPTYRVHVITPSNLADTVEYHLIENNLVPNSTPVNTWPSTVPGLSILKIGAAASSSQEVNALIRSLRPLGFRLRKGGQITHHTDIVHTSCLGIR